MTALSSVEGQANLPRYFASVFDAAKGMEAGRLDFVLPDGRRFRADGKEPGPVAELRIHNPDIFARLIREGDLGFSEAYLEGWWSTPDLQAFMDLVHVAGDDLLRRFPGMGLVRLFERLRFWLATATQAAGEEEHLLSLRSRQRFLRPLARRHDDLFLGPVPHRSGKPRGRADGEIRQHGRPDGRRARRSCA
jgi:hypothetical protein